MHYNLLWYGDIRGMKKARIAAITSHGMTGHLENDKLYVPCPNETRDALPYRLRAAYERGVGMWFDNNDDNLPCHMALNDRRGRYITTIYLQPIRES